MGGGYSYQLFTMYETYFDSNDMKMKITKQTLQCEY